MAALNFVTRVVNIRNSGSVDFSEEEQSSDIVLVDVQCLAIAGSQYVNKKTLPDNGFYGYVTLFGGATVAQQISLDYPYQRVVDFEQTYRRLYCFLTDLKLRLREIQAAVNAPPDVPPVGIGELPQSFDYRGLPFAKLKIKSLVSAQWEVRIRTYKEDNGFACQAMSRSDDPTDGEDEYPQPRPIPNPNEFPPGLPEPSPIYPGADPRDFDVDPNSFPRPVEFGTRVFLSSGQGQPNNCVQDVTISEIFTWEDAGPPPYSISLGGGSPSPCAGRVSGYQIVAADGTRSEVRTPLATTYDAIIIVYNVPNPE